MAIKKDMATDASETIIKVEFRPEDSVYDVYEKFNAAVGGSKSFRRAEQQFRQACGSSELYPRAAYGIHPLAHPQFLTISESSRAYCSNSAVPRLNVLTSMGSLGIPPIYHHLYDFGNLPIFSAFGAKRRENFMLPDGTVQQKKYIDFTVTTDERICDGFYFASSIKFMKRCLANPERLDEKPESVVRDVD